MRLVLIIFFLFNYIFSSGQEPVSTFTKLNFEFNWSKPIKSKIYTIKGNAFTAAITKITDRLVIYSVKDGIDNQTGVDTIPVSDIDKMKIKRKAIENGMLIGATVGGAAGYGIGHISYNDDASASYEDNQDRREGQAILGAIVGAVPGALVGGMIGGIFTKRVFEINGNPENILRLVNLLGRKKLFDSQPISE